MGDPEKGVGTPEVGGGTTLATTSHGDLDDALWDVTSDDHLFRRKVFESVRQTISGRGAPLKLARYVVGDRLGVGGAGVVYRARDPRLNRDVAIKLVRASNGSSQARDRRLVREAQAIAQLSHPNVVMIHDVGRYDREDLLGVGLGPESLDVDDESQSGVFIAMEYVAGASLDRWLRQKPRRWPQIVRVFLQAGRGLAAAHRIGLVHRDFKPSNVIVGTDGRVRVLDFGLVCPDVTASGSQSSDDASGALGGTPMWSSKVTEDGAIVGTPAYMSPEQRDGKRLTAATDQYSFCLSLREAVLERGPAAPEGGRRVQRLPKRLMRALERGLQSEPNERWPTLDSLLVELDRALDSKRRRVPMALGGAVAVGLGISAIVQARVPCEPLDTAEAWTSGIEAVRRTAGTAAASRLEVRAADWRTAQEQACAAAADRGGTPSWGRAECLARAAADMEAALDGLGYSFGSTEADVERVLETLSTAQHCRDSETLLRVEAAPQAERATEAGKLWHRLARLDVRVRLGLSDPSTAEAVERTIELADAVGDRALLARALRVRADLASSSGGSRMAVEGYKHAHLLAVRSRDGAEAVRSALALARQYARDGNAHDALLWERRARSELARFGRDPALQAALERLSLPKKETR